MLASTSVSTTYRGSNATLQVLFSARFIISSKHTFGRESCTVLRDWPVLVENWCFVRSKVCLSRAEMGCASSRQASSFPPDGQLLIAHDTNIWMEERLKGSIVYRNFKTPNRRSNYLLDRFVGSLAVTDQRIVGYARQKRQVNVPFTDKRIQEMKFSVEENDTLKISLDAGLFQPDWSGTIEYKFQTASAQNLVTRIEGSIMKNQ